MVPDKGFNKIQFQLQSKFIYSHQASGKPIASKITNTGFANIRAVELKDFMSTMAPNVLRPLFAANDVTNGPGKYKTMKHLIAALRLLDGHAMKISDIEVAHNHLLEFAKRFERHYGKHSVVPNFHFMLHLRDSIYKFGPISCFWVFNIERNNLYVKKINTNHKQGIEKTYMRQMQSNIFAYDAASVALYYDS